VSQSRFRTSKARGIKQINSRGTSPTGSQSRAIDEQESLHAAGYRQATHSGPRRASGQSAVAVQLFQVAGSASSGIRCFVGGAARRQMVVGTVKSTRCVQVGRVSCVVEGSMLEKPESAGVEQRLKVATQWLGMQQQILGTGFAVWTDIVSLSEMLAVKTVQPSR
jgi:hypothetical protein